MAKCDLKLIFERPERRFIVGEEVRGRLSVTVNADCKCDALTVECLWETHGRGNRSSGDSQILNLFTGELKAGETHSHEFVFKVPAGPVTYHGELINIDWYIRGRVDVPWAIDPKIEEDFVVAEPEAADVVLGGGSPLLEPYRGLKADALPADFARALQAQADLSGNPLGKVSLVVVGIFAAFALVFSSIFALVFASDFGFGACLIPGVFSLFVSVVGIKMAWNRFAQKKLGEVEVRFDPAPVGCRGGDRSFFVSFKPPGAVQINAVTAKVSCQEVAVSGSGTNKTTHRKTLSETELELGGARAINADEVVVYEGKASFPEDAAYTFQAPSNSVKWSVFVRVDVPRWPDWTHTFPITLAPRGIVAALESGAPPKTSDPRPLIRPADPEPEVEPAIATKEAPPAEAPKPEASELAAVSAELKTAGFSTDREEIFKRLAGRVWSLTLTVESVGSTSSFDARDETRDGQTVKGSAQGIELGIQFQPERSGEVSAWSAGDEKLIKAELTGFEPLAKMPLFTARG